MKTLVSQSKFARICGLDVYKRQTLYSAKAKKKAFKYQIKAVSRAAGYQVQYGVKKNMKGSKSKYVKKLNGTIKIKFTKKQKKKIKKKKLKRITYYVRVRAYKTLDGKRLYCAWSSKDVYKRQGWSYSNLGKSTESRVCEKNKRRGKRKACCLRSFCKQT